MFKAAYSLKEHRATFLLRVSVKVLICMYVYVCVCMFPKKSSVFLWWICNLRRYSNSSSFIFDFFQIRCLVITTGWSSLRINVNYASNTSSHPTRFPIIARFAAKWRSSNALIAAIALITNGKFFDTPINYIHFYEF